MFISQNGKSHTVYQLKDRSKGITTDTDIILQEIYDIEHARKTISLLRQDAGEYLSNNSSMSSCRKKNSEIFSFDLHILQKMYVVNHKINIYMYIEKNVIIIMVLQNMPNIFIPKKCFNHYI